MSSSTLNVYAVPNKSCGIPWDSHKRSFMEFIVPYTQDMWSQDSQLDIISSSYSFRSYGVIGERLYDLMIVMCSDSREYLSSDKVLGLFESFCRDILLFDFIKVFRNLIYTAENPHIISALMTMFNLLLASYNHGALMGIMSDDDVTVVTDEFDVLTIELIMVLMLRDKKNLTLKPSYRMSDKRAQKFWKYLTKRDVYGVIKYLRSMTENELLSYMTKFRSICKYAYTSNIFNEISQDFTYHNNMVSYAHWGREETVRPKSDVLRVYSSIFDDRFVSSDFLKFRNIYVREKGVRICFKKPVDGIESISLREYHTDTPFEEHLLLVHYEGEGISRFLPIDLTDYNHSYMGVMFEKDTLVLLLVYAWLGVLDRVNPTAEHMYSFFPDSRREAWDYLISSFENVRTLCYNVVSPDNIYYESPSHWNYKDSSRMNFKTDEEPVYANENRKIGRYTRALPIGQKPSPEAVRLAKRYFIELEEGKTLVDSFVRSQRIRLNK